MDILALVWATLKAKTLWVFVAGLLIGWNVIPQPSWIRGLWDKARNWCK